MSDQYRWSPSLEVGLSQIDSDHIDIFKLFDKLGEMAAGNRPDENFLNVSHQIREWSAHHFTHEESLMERLGYADRTIHQQEHVKFMNQITRFIRLHRVDDNNTLIQFQTVCSKWYSKHIVEMDRRLTEFFYGCDPQEREPALALSFCPFTEGRHNYGPLEGQIAEWRG